MLKVDIQQELNTTYRKLSGVPPGLYKSLLAQTSKDHDVIKKDVKRLPNAHPQLRHVLHAISIYQPTGYCQGLHLIVNYILELGYRPETTFIIFDCLLYHPTTNLLSYWNLEFPQLQADLKILQTVIMKRYKRVTKCMIENDIETPMFALRWLLCLFLQDIEQPEIQDYVFLYFLKKGRKALLHTALAACEQAEQKLKQDNITHMDLQEIIELLHNCCKHIQVEQIRTCKLKSEECIE
jgi:hypothetical protein